MQHFKLNKQQNSDTLIFISFNHALHLILTYCLQIHLILIYCLYNA